MNGLELKIEKLLKEQIRGRKEPPTELSRIFWQEFPNLLIDDPDDELNEIIGVLRNTAIKYFGDKTPKEK